MTIAIVLVAVTLAVVAMAAIAVGAVISAHARPDPAPPGGAGHRGVLAAVGFGVRTLLRVGVPLGPVMMVTVPGRRTGIPRSTPIDVFEYDGRRWLIATHDGDAAWVRNLRAAGRGTLTRGHRRLEFTAVEIAPDQAAGLIAAIASPRLNRRFGGLALRRTLALTAESDRGAYVRAATEHPLFELADAPATDTATERPSRAVTVLISAGILVAAAHLVLGISGLLDTAGWASGVVIGALIAGAGNHVRIFGNPFDTSATGRTPTPPAPE